MTQLREEGVQLMSDFLGKLSRNEPEKTYVCVVVSKHRDEFKTWHIQDLAP